MRLKSLAWLSSDRIRHACVASFFKDVAGVVTWQFSGSQPVVIAAVSPLVVQQVPEGVVGSECKQKCAASSHHVP